MKPQHTKSRAGFSLIEVLLVVIITGILVSLTSVAYVGLSGASKEKGAIGQAQAINLAKQSYKFRVSASAANWAGAADDAAKFLLIKDRITGVPNTTSLSTYQPTGYTFALGASLDTAVVITGPSGTVAY